MKLKLYDDGRPQPLKRAFDWYIKQYPPYFSWDSPLSSYNLPPPTPTWKEELWEFGLEVCIGTAPLPAAEVGEGGLAARGRLKREETGGEGREPGKRERERGKGGKTGGGGGPTIGGFSCTGGQELRQME